MVEERPVEDEKAVLGETSATPRNEGVEKQDEEWFLKEFVLGKADLDRIDSEARMNGFILLDELYLIMAEESIYSEILPRFWREYQCDRRGPKEIETYIKTDGGRIILWRRLLYRWCGFGVQGITEGLKAIKYLPIYKFEDQSGILKKVIHRSDPGLNYIKLENLKDYLNNIRKTLKIEFPLPKRLFPEDSEEEEKAEFGQDKAGESIRKQIDLESISSTSNPQFVFKKSGPGWQIVYDGELIGPLKAVGFNYMHFCMLEAPKSFSGIELENAINLKNKISDHNVEPRLDLQSDSEEDHKGFQVGGARAISGKKQELADEKAIKEIRKEIKRTEAELEKAKEEGEMVNADILERDLNRLEEEMDKLMYDGKFKTFQDDVNKISGRVNRAMARAIDMLIANPKAHDHFKKAFSPIHSSSHQYNPPEKIDWVLE